MVYTVQIIPILYFSMANDIEIVHKYICLMLTPQTYNRSYQLVQSLANFFLRSTFRVQEVFFYEL